MSNRSPIGNGLGCGLDESGVERIAWMGDVNFGVVNMYIIFKFMRLDNITRGMSTD